MKIGMNTSHFQRRGGKLAPALCATLVLGLLGGCETDSFFDPSTVGRWQFTPTVVPVLDRINSVEDESGDFVQTSPVQAGDLAPEAEQYRFGPGDSLTITVRDFFQIGGIEEPFKRVVDSRGNIDIPRLPPIRASGRTLSELRTAIEDTIRAERINDRPVVGIQIESQRKQTYSVLGAVKSPSTYYLPSPDYRLLEALTTAGGFEETIPYLFVIRQVYLTDSAAGISTTPEPASQPRLGQPRTPTTTSPDNPKEPDKELINLINDLSNQPKEPKPSPSIYAPPPDGAAPSRAPGAAPANPTAPPIDLPDNTAAPAAPPSPTGASRTGWVYVDGRWVKSGVAGPAGTDAAAGAKRQSTQRVIKVPTAPLLAGAADVNVVVRPGDVIRVPAPKAGLVYLAGNVNRPGPYSLPAEGRLTLLRAITAAGGVSAIGIPERVDITRRIGDDRQATVRVNLKAIGQGTQPDLYLKPDDIVNVGTNFWATPLAVLRNGFRTSYGFGFTLDRNFDANVFGPYQTSTNGG